MTTLAHSYLAAFLMVRQLQSVERFAHTSLLQLGIGRSRMQMQLLCLHKASSGSLGTPEALCDLLNPSPSFWATCLTGFPGNPLLDILWPTGAAHGGVGVSNIIIV